ncbi:hypothetical protein DdX_21483 [Ditylenchus destructor]|uniref:Uncharacterized protein n=1 Tax=Ditylenchus destructor TaxID=166010 RepID=A0AAD4MFH6_9BILA|nr:hypothetical protein DdX_21483 [Ditylenchus destructor]
MRFHKRGISGDHQLIGCDTHSAATAGLAALDMPRSRSRTCCASNLCAGGKSGERSVFDTDRRLHRLRVHYR